MHVPVYALVASAQRGFRRLDRLGMNGLKREIDERVLDLARINVLSFDLLKRLRRVAAAEWALVIRELH